MSPNAPPVLRPMDATSYARFRRESSAEYAREKVSAGQWPEAGSEARAEAEFAALLPQGLATPGHYLFDILAEDGVEAVGHLWWACEDRHGMATAYVYDLAVQPQHQRRGHASRAFRAMEQQVREHNIWRIDLHVFGHNPGAQALYARLGYQVTSVMMAKALE